MKTDDFDYDLPESFIAQQPADPRDSCKLLVLHKDGEVEHKIFHDIIDFINPRDLLVINETRVLPARLFGKKPTGANVEVLLLNEAEGAQNSDNEQVWDCLVRPGKRLKIGAEIQFFDEDDSLVMNAEVEGIDEENGSRKVHFHTNEASFNECIHKLGRTPLPPYITEYKGSDDMYQTVYAKTERSAAAPTAGLHFTPELLARIQDKGARIAKVDLEVGLDTFRTVSEDDPRDHEMHTELYSVPQETVQLVEETKQNGGRVIAVGTTSVRSLESAAASGTLQACERKATKLYILPGYEFKVVDALITNFHVPRSTLLMLVSALSSRENIFNAYEEAKEEGYRFFSFGDAMLIL
jgi:S-adenosylmethionine:tRNA ribosyltransferase-isomerase